MRAAARSCAIDKAVVALHQCGIGCQGVIAVIAAGKDMQSGQHPISADFENGAIVVCATAVLSRAI